MSSSAGLQAVLPYVLSGSAPVAFQLFISEVHFKHLPLLEQKVRVYIDIAATI